jgi:hypothetical protein
MNGKLLMIVATLVLTASASRAEFVGFKKFQLSEDTWAVRYVGNAIMGKLKVRKALLCKTAQLAQKEGYFYFSLLDEEGGEGGGALYITATPNYFTGGATYVAGQTHYHTYEATARFSREPLGENQQTAAELQRFWQCK